jgi:thioesterase domain-containing protein
MENTSLQENSVLQEMLPVHEAPPYGKAYLQSILSGEFALARHIGIVVECADDTGIVLCAPLAPNANDKGTAFGGSLFSVAVLTGWSWVTRYLAAAGLAAEAVIQESTIKYLVPVQGSFRATLHAPSPDQIEKFRKMLQRAGRGRIRLKVDIHHGRTLATEFEGVFAAALRVV